MAETMYKDCEHCKKQLSGYGMEDLNKNYDAHQQHVHSNLKLESQKQAVKEEQKVQTKVESKSGLSRLLNIKKK